MFQVPTELWDPQQVPTELWDPQQPIVIFSFDLIGLGFECAFYTGVCMCAEGPKANNMAAFCESNHLISNHAVPTGYLGPVNFEFFNLGLRSEEKMFWLPPAAKKQLYFL